MASKAGIIGTFQPPMSRDDVSSVYMIFDEEKQCLYIFVLFPGAYMDAYEVASRVKYPNIVIVPVSTDALFVSDVVRLANDLIPYKNYVGILTPGKMPTYIPSSVQRAILRTGYGTRASYTQGFIAFNYKMNSSIYQPNFYDIYLTFKQRRVLLCPFMVDKTRLLTLLKDNRVDWIYVPYSDPLFGEDCFVTILTDEYFAPYLNKIVAIGFRDNAHAEFCRLRYPNNYPRTMRSLFLNNITDVSTMYDNDSGNVVVIGGVPNTKVTIEDFLPEGTPTINHYNKPNLPDPPGPFIKPIPPAKPEKHDLPDTNGELEIGSDS